MNKYMITASRGKGFDASSKARDDAEKIAAACGYQAIPSPVAASAHGNPLIGLNIIFKTFRILKKLGQLPNNSIILIQYPYYPVKMMPIMIAGLKKIRKRKGIRFIALIHDLNSLRRSMGRINAYTDHRLLSDFDAIICHNEVMKELLTEWGVSPDKQVPLEWFDYLTDAAIPERNNTEGIVVAGNLVKSHYLQSFMKETGILCPVHLYGAGGDQLPLTAAEGSSFEENLFYWHGMVSPEVLPGIIHGSYGLVWDGESITTCSGVLGEYLRWNNPHKASLYLASGLPLIVWEQSALARIVCDSGIGFSVSSLHNMFEMIDSITMEQYLLMQEKAAMIGRDLHTGRYLTRAIRQAEEIAFGSK